MSFADLFLLGQQLFLLTLTELCKLLHSFPAIVQIRNQSLFVSN
jgi:hypothetical protein